MKCIYYLAPTLLSAQRTSYDLRPIGVRDSYLHVVAKDEAGLRQQNIRSANYFERLDLIQDGTIGAGIGFVVGLAGIGLLVYFEPFGPDVPGIVYVQLVVAATLFGAWDGGLAGIDSENRKLRTFRAQIEAGQYLMLIYVRKRQEAAVLAMMQRCHPEATLMGVDTQAINPFSTVKPAAVEE